MILRDLKEFVNKLPVEFDKYTCVNGEYAILNENEENLIYRVDKPILVLNVDESDKEICFLHQSREEIEKIWPQNGDTK